jgi:hypothetical protein
MGALKVNQSNPRVAEGGQSDGAQNSRRRYTLPIGEV